MTDRTNRRLSRWLRGVCLAAVAVCAGCSHGAFCVRQTDHPRSLEDLYFEAFAARQNYPENTVCPPAGEVVSPPSPLDPQFPPGPAPPPLPIAVGQTANPVSHVGTIQRVSAVGREAGGVQTAQGFSPAFDHAGPPVSEIFEDTDVRQAIQVLATQAGVSVIVDEQVGGVTSAVIENEPFEQALSKILLPLGLVHRFDQGQYLVGTPDPTSALFPLIADTFEFRPQHLAPQELLPLLPERLQVFVRVIEKRNLMIIEAPRETALRIVEQLQQSDQPVPQVLLEAMVCVFNPNQTFQFTADMRQSLNLDGKEVLDIGTLGLAVTGFVSPIGLEKAFSDFAKTSTFLRLLAQEGYVTIRAAPRVMSKDGEKATIKIERETYFALQPSDADIIFRQDVQKVDAGIVLDIVPVIRGDMVTVTIEKAEVSEDIREIDRNTTDLLSQFPLINRRQVSTTVHVKDGQTIVIGGLMQRQTVDRYSHVPYLHAIPLLGKLFERVDQEDKAAEVAIFISPRIIRPAVMPVATAAPVMPEGEPYSGPVMPLAPATPPVLTPPAVEIAPPPVIELPPPTLPPVSRPQTQSTPVPQPSPASTMMHVTPPEALPASGGTPQLRVLGNASIPAPQTPPPLPMPPASSSAPATTELRFVLPRPAVNATPPEPKP